MGVGISPATYTTHVTLEIPGDSAYDPQTDESGILDVTLGARLLTVPRPMADLRPVLGGGFRYMMGPATPDTQLPTESAFLPPFAGNHLGLIEAIGGIEYTTAGGRDLTAWVPVGLGLLGGTGQTYEAGETDLLTVDRDRSSARISVGIELGVGVRKGGG